MTDKLRKHVFEQLFPTLVQHQKIISKHKLISISDVIIFIFLTIAVVIFEAGGLALLLPILSFLKNDRDPFKFANDTELGQKVFDVYQFIGVPLNFFSLSVVVLVMITIRQFLNYLLTLKIDTIKVGVARDLSLKAFSAILKSKTENIEKYKTGQFSAILTHESQSSAALLRVYSRLLTLSLTFSVYFSAMIFISPLASVGSIILVASITFLLGHFGKITRDLSNRRIITRSNLLNFLNERIKAWKLIKLADTLDIEIKNASGYIQDDMVTEFRVGKIAALIQLIMAPAVIFFALSAVYVAVENFSIDIETIAAFILILLRLIPVGQGFNGARHSLTNFTPSLLLLDKVIGESFESKEAHGHRKSIKPLKNSLQFKNISFSHINDPKKIFLHTSFSIPAGMITAVVGPSGAGKTTLIDLITRIRKPDCGTVLYDDVPVDEYDLDLYRNELVCMLQDMVLFDGSVEDSIRYFNQYASDNEIRKAAKLAYAHEFIQKLESGYKTNIGEGGFKLSGGEKQRLALARLFLSKANLVILDEPTSALDRDSEAKVLKAIKKLVETEGRTVIIIAHRIATIQIAHQVLKLVGDGTVSISSSNQNNQHR